jgi:general secretion pathway protein G
MFGFKEARGAMRAGFTLIELLVAIAILAILIGGVVPFAMKQLESAKISGAKRDLQAFKSAINMYQIAVGSYPQTLKDLIKTPREEQAKKRWTQGGGPFVEGEELKQDPWNNPYKYKLTPGTQHPYELYTYGKNGPGSPKAEYISVWDN